MKKSSLNTLASTTASIYAIMYPNDVATTYTMEMDESRTLSAHIRVLIEGMDDFQREEIKEEARSRGAIQARVMAEAIHEMEWTRYLNCVEFEQA